MRLMVPPWEGTHAAFPEQTEPYKISRLHPVEPVAGAIGLALAGTLRLLSLASGRTWKPGTSMAAIGAVALGTGILTARPDYASRGAAQALLDKEGIKMPPQRIWTPTEKISVDDAGFGGMLFGLLGAALHRRPQLGFMATAFRIFGFATVGGTMGFLAYTSPLAKGTLEAQRDRTVRDQTIAAAVYRRIMQTDPPASLYLEAARASKGNGFTVGGEDASKYLNGNSRFIKYLFSEPTSDTATSAAATSDRPSGGGVSQVEAELERLKSSIMELGDMRTEISADKVLIAEEAGTFAFQALTFPDGSVRHTTQRDYLWQPATPAEGIKALEEFIDVEQKRRLEYVQTAEYVWRLTALWEARYHSVSEEAESPTNDDKLTLCIKACELLNSTHQNFYKEIADIDWLIAEARKVVLQFQNGGKWLPSSAPASYDPKTYKPSVLLETIQAHRAHLETLGGHPLDGNAENFAATAMLEKQVKQQVDSPGTLASKVEEVGDWDV